tara:strand:- start:490 stop:2058 length:1569 start_codon:yes stop_codon:yes gene_type:complete
MAHDPSQSDIHKVGLSTEIFNTSGEKLQQGLEQIRFLQDQILITDNEKRMYDRAINKIDTNLVEQCNVVNRDYNNVETEFLKYFSANARSDLFWRVINEFETDGDTEYNLICTKLTPGGYSTGYGATVFIVNPENSSREPSLNDADKIWRVPANKYQQEEGPYTFSLTRWYGFNPKEYYGIKVYDEPYQADIGNTLVGSFIGTITSGEATLTIMNPVGAGLSEHLSVGQLIVPEDTSIFTGTVKIAGITTGLVDLRNIESFVGIGETLSWVNILTVDKNALKTIVAPLEDGRYETFEILDDPDNFATQGRNKYSIPKETDPFVVQTVGIMQTSTIGTGVKVALDHSGYPNAPQSWDPNLEGYVVEYSSTGTALAGPVEEPKVGSGRCFWKIGFFDQSSGKGYFPKLGNGNPAEEGDTRTSDDLANVYTDCTGSVTGIDTASLETVSTASSTALENDLTARTTKLDGLNSLREERNQTYSLPIWGMRVGIGAENEVVDRLQTLHRYVDDLTVRNVIDDVSEDS